MFFNIKENDPGWKLEKQDGMKNNKRGKNVSKFMTVKIIYHNIIYITKSYTIPLFVYSII